ncbi:alkaline phosphatase D family protein [Bordetella genomosp. 13]|uniref:alkaline phosphatase D family protein n=1 Tax=Bordetella genomosp. 13 TaxID=463040 RepID=UPI0011A20326|nr:alkaline phosphatase D family protein [Bordetella genomosp. 13]
MDRRNFIKWGSFLTVSVAMTGTLTACGSDHDSDDDEAGNGGGGNDTPPRKLAFAQGIASGDPRPDSIILWTRIDGADGTHPVNVRVQLASDQAFAHLLVDEPVQADAAWDYTVRHKVTGLNPATTYFYRFVAGDATSTAGRTKTAPAAGASVAQLKFAFISCQDWNANHWGAFDEMLKEDLDFVVHLGDYIYESLPAHVPVGLAEAAHAPLALPDGTRQADGSIYATTVADYRALYKQYRADPRLQALHARFPMIAIWDDHEFSDDAWQDHQTYAADDDRNHQTQRRRSASQAWFEFMPADVSFDAKNPAFDNIQIYRSFQFGSLATLVMTDERLYRADHVIPEAAAGGFLGSRYLVPQKTLADAEAAKIAGAGNALTPVSMLGDTQRTWWQKEMLSSQGKTAWRLWGNEVSLLRMQVDGQEATVQLLADAIVATSPDDLQPVRDTLIVPAVRRDVAALKASGTLPAAFTNVHALFDPIFGKPTVDAAVAALNTQLPPLSFLNKMLINADQWDGYNGERKALMGFLKDNGIKNVVSLTGDIHAFFAGQVMDDYDAATPVPVMVDLVTAGVSSSSLFRFFVDQVHTEALASLAPLVYQNITNKLNGTLGSNNAWLKHVDTDAHGYTVVTLKAESLVCDFKSVKPLVNGALPAAPLLAGTYTVTVPSGAPTVQLPQST